MVIKFVPLGNEKRIYRSLHNEETGAIYSEDCPSSIDVAELEAMLLLISDSHKTKMCCMVLENTCNIQVEIPFDLSSFPDGVGYSYIPVLESNADRLLEKATISPDLLLFDSTIKAKLEEILAAFEN